MENHAPVLNYDQEAGLLNHEQWQDADTHPVILLPSQSMASTLSMRNSKASTKASDSYPSWSHTSESVPSALNTTGTVSGVV